MAKSEKDIRKAIANFARGGGYKNCRVGIGEDGRRRIQQQGADPDNALILTGNTTEVVRRIEQDFLDKGMSGGPGGGSEESKQIYVFKKKRK